MPGLERLGTGAARPPYRSQRCDVLEHAILCPHLSQAVGRFEGCFRSLEYSSDFCGCVLSAEVKCAVRRGGDRCGGALRFDTVPQSPRRMAPDRTAWRGAQPLCRHEMPCEFRSRLPVGRGVPRCRCRCRCRRSPWRPADSKTRVVLSLWQALARAIASRNQHNSAVHPRGGPCRTALSCISSQRTAAHREGCYSAMTQSFPPARTSKTRRARQLFRRERARPASVPARAHHGVLRSFGAELLFGIMLSKASDSAFTRMGEIYAGTKVHVRPKSWTETCGPPSKNLSWKFLSVPSGVA